VGHRVVGVALELGPEALGRGVEAVAAGVEQVEGAEVEAGAAGR
jgi:hypothetical protein